MRHPVTLSHPHSTWTIIPNSKKLSPVVPVVVKTQPLHSCPTSSELQKKHKKHRLSPKIAYNRLSSFFRCRNFALDIGKARTTTGAGRRTSQNEVIS